MQRRRGGRKFAPRDALALTRQKLEAVAIIRDGVLHRQESRGSHWEIRLRLGDFDPNQSRRSDEEGFVTKAGRFVGRAEAKEIALASGQLRAPMDREMLSSDLDW